MKDIQKSFRLFGNKLINSSQTSPISNFSEYKTTSIENLNADPCKKLPLPIGTGRPTPKKIKKPEKNKENCSFYCPQPRKDVKIKQTNVERMRGGGSADYETQMFPTHGDFTWYNSKFMQPRMEGGGCGETYPSIGCSKPAYKRAFPPINDEFVTLDNPGYLSTNRCKLKHDDDPLAKCSCAPRDAIESGLRKGYKPNSAVCQKKTCMGPDCLIKAFKDAQEFVDSIGKVPGLAGLGIVQGPYFQGVTQQKEPPKPEPKAQSPNKPIPCCDQANVDNVKKLAATSNNANIARKSGLIQEGISALPDPAAQVMLKAKNKVIAACEKAAKENEPPPVVNQINEDSPCGEPKCKSKPKKKEVVEQHNGETNEHGDEKPEERRGTGISMKNQPRSMDKKNSKSKNNNNYNNSKSSPNLPKPKQSMSYDYNYGKNPPISVYGHKNCSQERTRVPAKMGWAWNKTDAITKMKPRPGWKPGAISSTVHEMLIEAKEGFFKESMMRPFSAPSKGKRRPSDNRPIPAKKRGEPEVEEVVEDIEFPPTLHIHRKDGIYYVTMYPIRQETQDLQRLDEPINPLQFKIVKSKGSIASSSTASDMEIEFSPPAAVNRLKRKPNVVHVNTQAKDKEIDEEIKAKNADKYQRESQKAKKGEEHQGSGGKNHSAGRQSQSSGKNSKSKKK